MFIDLDANENIEKVMINGNIYSIGDIPESIIERISNIDVNKKNIYEKRSPIIEDILKIKNEEVQEIQLRTEEKIGAFIWFITEKIINDKKKKTI